MEIEKREETQRKEEKIMKGTKSNLNFLINLKFQFKFINEP